MTTTQITPQQQFEEKVKDRLRVSMGDLMPDEVLAEMVRKSLDDFFFQDRKRSVSDYYGRVTQVDQPGWFSEAIKQKIGRQLNRLVEREIRRSFPKVFEEIKAQFVKDAPGLILAAMTNQILLQAQNTGFQQLTEFQSRLTQKIGPF